MNQDTSCETKGGEKTLQGRGPLDYLISVAACLAAAPVISSLFTAAMADARGVPAVTVCWLVPA